MMMRKPLSDGRRVLLLLVWLVALGVVVMLGLNPETRFSSSDLIPTLRLWVPLIVAGLITLIVHMLP